MAATHGYLELLELFLQHDVNVNIRNSFAMTPLLSAVVNNGGADVVQLLLSHGADIDAVNIHGFTALHHASFRKDSRIVELLLQKGADYDAITSGGWSPLAIAANKRNWDYVRLLLRHNADPTAGDEYNQVITAAVEDGEVDILRRVLRRVNHIERSGRRSPLYAAAISGREDMVTMLLDHGADVNFIDPHASGGTLGAAVAKNSLKLAQMLLEAGANVDLPRSPSQRTPLIDALDFDHAEMAQMLIDHGADINAVTSEGGSALHYAASRGLSSLVLQCLQGGAKTEVPLVEDGRTPLFWAMRSYNLSVVKHLLDFGASTSAITTFQRTLAMDACQLGFVEVLPLLLERHNNVDARQQEGWTVLHLAANGFEGHERPPLTKDFDARRRDLTAAEILLSRGADIEAISGDGRTPLHLAAQAGSIEIAQLLIDRGADITRNLGGGTPLHFAARQSSTNIAELLIGHGADINARDNDQETPLHCAALLGSESNAKLLIDRGADINMQDADGETPLHIAALHGRDKIVEYLLAQGAECRLSLPIYAAFRCTAYCYAIMGRHAHIAHRLAQFPEQIVHDISDGHDYFMCCCVTRKNGRIRLGLKTGLNVDRPGLAGTALAIAAVEGQLDMVKLLIEHEANLQGDKESGIKPLTNAVRGGHVEVVRYLLNKGAKLSKPLPRLWPWLKETMRHQKGFLQWKSEALRKGKTQPPHHVL